MTKYKHGTLYKESNILKMWNKRIILLNSTNNILTLSRPKKKKGKAINVTKYSINWVEAKKK